MAFDDGPAGESPTGKETPFAERLNDLQSPELTKASIDQTLTDSFTTETDRLDSARSTVEQERLIREELLLILGIQLDAPFNSDSDKERAIAREVTRLENVRYARDSSVLSRFAAVVTLNAVERTRWGHMCQDKVTLDLVSQL